MSSRRILVLALVCLALFSVVTFVAASDSSDADPRDKRFSKKILKNLKAKLTKAAKLQAPKIQAVKALPKATLKAATVKPISAIAGTLQLKLAKAAADAKKKVEAERKAKLAAEKRAKLEAQKQVALKRQLAAAKKEAQRKVVLAKKTADVRIRAAQKKAEEVKKQMEAKRKADLKKRELAAKRKAAAAAKKAAKREARRQAAAKRREETKKERERRRKFFSQPCVQSCVNEAIEARKILGTMNTTARIELEDALKEFGKDKILDKVTALGKTENRKAVTKLVHKELTKAKRAAKKADEKQREMARKRREAREARKAKRNADRIKKLRKLSTKKSLKKQLRKRRVQPIKKVTLQKALLKKKPVIRTIKPSLATISAASVGNTVLNTKVSPLVIKITPKNKAITAKNFPKINTDSLAIAKTSPLHLPNKLTAATIRARRDFLTVRSMLLKFLKKATSEVDKALKYLTGPKLSAARTRKLREGLNAVRDVMVIVRREAASVSISKVSVETLLTQKKPFADQVKIWHGRIGRLKTAVVELDKRTKHLTKAKNAILSAAIRRSKRLQVLPYEEVAHVDPKECGCPFTQYMVNATAIRLSNGTLLAEDLSSVDESAAISADDSGSSGSEDGYIDTFMGSMPIWAFVLMICGVVLLVAVIVVIAVVAARGQRKIRNIKRETYYGSTESSMGSYQPPTDLE